MTTFQKKGGTQDDSQEGSTTPAIKRNLNEEEASAEYGPSVHWFRRARWKGDGPRFVKLAGKVLYPRHELEAFFASRLRRSTSDRG